MVTQEDAGSGPGTGRNTLVDRPVPVVAEGAEDFWRGGAHGLLLISACLDCERLFHPPAPLCPHCYSRRVGSRPVSGRAVVVAFTVTHRPWVPGYDSPYVVARVALREDDTVQLLTNIVECEPGEVASGMEVDVVFEARGDVFVPMFRPAR